MSRAPHITDINPNSPEFRRALAAAGNILAGDADFSVYSHHTHFTFRPNEVMFEEQVTDGVLALYPVSREEGQAKGLPSCWSFAPDGTVIEMRYASWTLHEHSGLDVTSEEFQARLFKIGQAFAAAGLHETLELNIAGKLFPREDGQLTREVTDMTTRRQEVTLVPTPKNVKEGDWALAACWSFSAEAEVIVTGFCFDNDWTRVHRKRDN